MWLCVLFFVLQSCFRSLSAHPIKLVSPEHFTRSRKVLPAIIRENGTVSIIEGDIAVLSNPVKNGTEGAASFARFSYWPENPVGSKTYQAVYNLDAVNFEVRERIKWVWRYLERGTNIRFREAHPGERDIVVVFHGEGCYSDASIPGRLSLGRNCDTLHTIAHETLHSIGVMHEHQRADRDAYLVVDFSGLSSGWIAQISPNPMGIHTEYDYASIMHYEEVVGGSGFRNLMTTKPEYRKYITRRRTWLSRCDWTLLNLLYPGKRKPPKCYPHKVPDLLEPASTGGWTFISGSPIECFYSNEGLFERGMCVFKTTHAVYPAMPTIEEELGFNPEEHTDSEEARSRKKKKKKHHRKKTKLKKKKKGSKDKGSESAKVTIDTGDGSEDSDSEKKVSTKNAKRVRKGSKGVGDKKDGDDADKDSAVGKGGDTGADEDSSSDREETKKKSKKNRERTSGKRERRHRYASFSFSNCKELISIDPSRMSDKQCRLACSKGCKKHFPDLSLQDCLSSSYYVCLPPDIVLNDPSGALPLVMARVGLSVILIYFLWELM